MNRKIAVAIDGPSGAGKSTIARILAQQLHYIYVDTGALYRTVGYAALKEEIDPADGPAVEAMLPRLQVELRHVDGLQRVFLNGEDVSDCIRTPAVSMAASKVSALPAVRQYLFSLQQDTAAAHDVIMDGRDIGTVVLPHAQVKIFLTASAEDRAARRYAELQEKKVDTTFDEVLADMKQRDYDDAHRAAAPLKAADDAVVVDTTGNTLKQSVEALKKVVLERLAAGEGHA